MPLEVQASYKLYKGGIILLLAIHTTIYVMKVFVYLLIVSYCVPRYLWALRYFSAQHQNCSACNIWVRNKRLWILNSGKVGKRWKRGTWWGTNGAKKLLVALWHAQYFCPGNTIDLLRELKPGMSTRRQYFHQQKVCVPASNGLMKTLLEVQYKSLPITLELQCSIRSAG